MIKLNEVAVNGYITQSKLPDADFVVNPYIGCPHKCIYCYAEFMKRFTNHTEDTWGDFLDVKLCEDKINTKKLGNASVLFGSVTDAYNPYEKKYEITRKLLSQFIDSAARVEILTKSDLVLRDIDIISKIPNIRVGISMNSLNHTFSNQTEPFAASPERRVEALRKLHDAGVKTYLFMSPIFPGITDFVEVISAVRKFVDSFYFENLNLRAGYFSRVMSYIAEKYPNLVELYDQIYRHKNMQFWQGLSREIQLFCEKEKLDYKLYFYHEKIKKGGNVDE